MKNTRTHRLRTTLAAALTAVMVAFSAAPALAQQNKDDKNKDDLVTPTPAPPRQAASHLWGYLAAILLGAIVIGVNFIPSKRGHQD